MDSFQPPLKVHVFCLEARDIGVGYAKFGVVEPKSLDGLLMEVIIRIDMSHMDTGRPAFSRFNHELPLTFNRIMELLTVLLDTSGFCDDPEFLVRLGHYSISGTSP